MTESAIDLSDITCPGCHFECKLNKYQCARGKEFYDLGASGQAVPERRWPMFTPSELAAGRDKQPPPLNDRVMHGLNIMANVLQERHTQASGRKVVIALGRSGGFMSIGLLSKRTQIPYPELGDVLDMTEQAGLVVLSDEPHSGRIASLTDAGQMKLREWREEQANGVSEFLSPLSEDEKAQLEHLIRKLTKMPTPPSRKE